MPRLSGTDTAKQLREKGYDNIPIIGLTGYGMPDEIEAFRDGGADSVLKKPLEYEELLDAYHKALEARKINT